MTINVCVKFVSVQKLFINAPLITLKSKSKEKPNFKRNSKPMMLRNKVFVKFLTI